MNCSILINSISKDSEEIINFINIFIEENGQPPAFNIFESCEQVAKRYVNNLHERDYVFFSLSGLVINRMNINLRRFD